VRREAGLQGCRLQVAGSKVRVPRGVETALSCLTTNWRENVGGVCSKWIYRRGGLTRDELRDKEQIGGNPAMHHAGPVLVSEYSFFEVRLVSSTVAGS
jgi:hypothetical protein